MQDTLLPARHNRLCWLTEKEMADPFLVIRDVFSSGYIQEIRKMLWIWLRTGLAQHRDPEMPEIYERLEKLLEAIYLIYEEKKAKGRPAGVYNRAMDDQLQDVVRLIVSLADPEKIFLVNQNGIDHAVYHDLLIVIPDHSQKAFKEYSVIIEMACARQEQISFSLHKSCDIQRLLSEGHIYYSGVCTKNNLVYDNGMTGLPVLTAAKAEFVRERAEKDFLPGFNKAVAFLEGARQYFVKNDNQMTAFMLHQAIELCFRAIVLSFSGQDYRTHCLRALKKQCRRYAPQLSDLFPDDTEIAEALLQQLENAYIDVRYKDNYEISGYELSLLLEKTALLQHAAKEFFEEKVTGLSAASIAPAH